MCVRVRLIAARVRNSRLPLLLRKCVLCDRVTALAWRSRMRFLRGRVEVVALVLMALVSQMLLVSSHSHAGASFRAGASSRSAAYSRSASFFQPAHSTLRTTPLACKAFIPPPLHQPCHTHHDDGCAVCWTLSAAGTALLSAPPHQPAARHPGLRVRVAPVEVAVARRGAVAFQARAPPRAVAG